MAPPMILNAIYGEDWHFMTLSNPAVPNIVLRYTTFDQITDDISDARVYGGIHFRTDQVAGVAPGKGDRQGPCTRKTYVAMHDDGLSAQFESDSPFLSRGPRDRKCVDDTKQVTYRTITYLFMAHRCTDVTCCVDATHPR